MQDIPVIDISALRAGGEDPDRQECVSRIMTACTEIGFLSIAGHGVLPETTDRMRDLVRRIFDVDEAQKWAGAITRENYRGYIPLGFFTPNDGSGAPDLYEGYKLHHEVDADDPIRLDCALYGPNRWPDGIADARRITLDYWRALDGVARDLLSALEQALDIAPGALCGCFETPMTNMTLLHYPPQPPRRAGYGIHPHKDTDALTIIAHDPVGGLEVQMPDGRWIAAACPPGDFIVNIGDMLELWSGGRLVSTPHRVINTSGKERYSFPYFAVPRHDVVVAPLMAPVAGFDRPPVHTGHWSREIWRTNWPDEAADANTPELGTLHDRAEGQGA